MPRMRTGRAGGRFIPSTGDLHSSDLSQNKAPVSLLNSGDRYFNMNGAGSGLSPSSPIGWAGLMALGGAALDGKTLVGLTDTLPLVTLNLSGNTNPITIIPRDPANPPTFDQLNISGVTNIILRQLSLVSSAWSAVSNASNPCVLFSGAGGTVVIDTSCTFKGNYRGDVTAIFDPLAEYPEYACVSATMVGGVVTALTVPHPYVGDLLAPGTYSLVMNETGGTGFSGTFTVTHTTINGVTGNFITSTTLTNGGTGYTMTLNAAARLTWAGQHRMFEYIVEAMRSSGSLVKLTVAGCTMRDVRNGIKITAPTSELNYDNNDVQRIYESGFSVGLANATAPPLTSVKDNFFSLGFYSSDDAGNPHGGIIRPSMNATTPADWVGTLERNVYVPGPSRGKQYFGLLSDNPAGIYYRWRIVGNLGLSNGGATALAMDGVKNCYVHGNRLIRYNPNDADTASVSIILPEPTFAANVAGKSFVGGNITETLSNLGGSRIVTSGNVVLGVDPGAAAYGAKFANPTSLPTTKAAALAAFAQLDTSFGAGIPGYLDYNAQTTNVALEPTFVNFSGLGSQLLGVPVSSEWCQVLGGPAIQNWSVTNGTAQVADDASGTNATVAAASGTVAPGKFMRINQTTSGTNSATITSVLTINGYTYNFQSTTTSGASFATVDNQSTAWSKTNAPATEAGLSKFVIACRFKPDVLAVNASPFCDSTATGMRLFMASLTAWRWQFISSLVTHRSAHVPNTNWQTHIMAIDLTQTDPNLVSRWVIDDGSGFVDVPQAASSVAGDGSGTQTKSTGNFIASSLGLFAKTDGTDLMDGQHAFLLGHYAGSSFTMPDIYDPVFQNMFTADNINLADGSGPLGIQPKIFINDTAAHWNAGFSGKGSQALTVTKQAGTYA